ncbi:hypothetical protein DFH06DRAFT_704976 [Mycena polygramma]|nr:hypothetical protein DFH06DRAFT_704976 [Mycena polygramma]
MFESIVDDKPGNSQLELNLRVGNIVIVFLYVNNLNLRAAADVTVTTDNSGSDTQLCGNSSILVGLTTTVKCSVPWTVLAHSQNITAVVISAKFPDSKGTLYVKPGQGDPSDVDSYGEVIPLMAGSHLSGILSRTEPDLFSINTQDICGIATPYRQIMLTPVLHLQADPFPPVDTGPNNTVSLRLRMRANNMNPFSSAPQIQIVRDFTDSSGLNGLATAGGFWTFVNGAFAMVFGANILYFLFTQGDGHFLRWALCTYFSGESSPRTGTRISLHCIQRAVCLDLGLRELSHFFASAWWISTTKITVLQI